MAKIDFKIFKIYTSINRKTSKTVDVRETFADIIYKNVSGIRAHSVAMKIYNSDGETEYSPEEVTLIKNVAERFCLPGFIDGLEEQINNKEDTADGNNL